MKYIVDTEKGTCVPYIDVPRETSVILADLFEEKMGAREWDETVGCIQKWYYGSYVKDNWCATAVSYFSNLAGKLDQTGKHENVDRMKEYMNNRGRLDCTLNYGGGAYTPKRGDIVFMSSNHTYGDCTHVGVISKVNNDTGHIVVVSGNSSDKIQQTSGNYKTNRYYVAFGEIL